MAVDKEKFSGVWNAERVLNVYLILANNKGNKEDLAIRYSQFQSAIKAFSSLVGDPEADVSAVEIDFAGGLYLDPLMTGEQCLKFRRLVQRNILDTSPYFQYQMKDLGKYLASHYFRTNIFKILIRYRSAAQRLLDQTFKTCEYDSEFAQAIGKIQQLYESNIHGSNTILEQLICLLMGKSYETLIPEWKLIEDFDYPPYTEKEVENMFYDKLYCSTND